MASPDSGGFVLDSSQETIIGTMPYQGEVAPPASRLVQWAYSLVVEAEDHAVPFSVTLLDLRGEQVASDPAVDGVASIEAELHEQTYDLRIESERPTAFRAICTQTFGYRQ